MNKTKRLKEIRKEIKHYEITDEKVIEKLEDLCTLGFEFTGHGTNLITQEEDFSLVYDFNKKDNCSNYISVTMLVRGRKAGKISYQLNLADPSAYVYNKAIEICDELYDWIIP